jgi:putative ABC transport system permease protein
MTEPALNIFWQLMIKPLVREPVRAVLTILAVALGVAVVLAMDLAGEAATGSFHSSLETLSGDQTLEITAAGGVPEEIVATLTSQPYNWQITPRIEDYAVIPELRRTIPLLGLDLIAEGNRLALDGLNERVSSVSETFESLVARDTVWVGRSLGKKPGERLELLINDRRGTYTVSGVFPDQNGAESAIVMDIANAQSALQRSRRIDRIFIRVPGSGAADSASAVKIDDWLHRAQQILPKGVEVRPAGAATDENRKMLSAFRWNLRLLSYIALIVGAFLIYNTISVSVARRRAEIGIVRAVGASPGQVLAAFLLEAFAIGFAGTLLGLPLGRLMAGWAVKLMGTTVSALYVSSRPGEIVLNSWSIALAVLVGTGVTLLSAWSPAHEAARVAPIEAMARGRREFEVRVHQNGALCSAAILAVVAAILTKLAPVHGKPLFGYIAALLLIIAGALAVPAFVEAAMRLTSRPISRILGVEGLLAPRSLSASLRRTSVLVAALSTAVAMMTAIAIMVGSFRQTVVLWMDSELPADLYLRPAGSPAADQHPIISPELSDAISKLPGIRSVQRLRAYEINYQGMPATLGSVDLDNSANGHSNDYLSGRQNYTVIGAIRGAQAVIISEPFGYKHHLQRGDQLILTLGETTAAFRVEDIYYDYASERGVILMDRNVLLKFLPDPAASNMAVFLAPGFTSQQVRTEIEAAAANLGAHILIFSNADLRSQAVQIFDRTFAITYALEAVAVLVAIMGVAGALLALIIDRRREFGLLRYLGASSAQLRKIVLAEAALIGALANLAGVTLGCLLSLILIFVVNKQSFGWTIRLHWPFEVLFGAVSLVWIATLLAGYYPARIAVRLNPVEVGREE